MVKKSEELLSLLEHPEYFLNAQKKTLESRIEMKKLDNEETKTSKLNSGLTVAKKVSMDLLNKSWGDLIVDVIDTHKVIEDKLNESKEALLLAEYLNKADNQEEALKKLVGMITDPYGSILFNKLLLILKDYPADGDMMDIVRDALLNLSDTGNFQRMFTRYKFLISLIDTITPQAFVILQDYLSWPPFNMATVILNGGRIQGDMSHEFAVAYARYKGITDGPMISRIEYSIQELQKNDFVFGTQLKPGQAILKLSNVGKDLVNFVYYG